MCVRVQIITNSNHTINWKKKKKEKYNPLTIIFQWGAVYGNGMPKPLKMYCTFYSDI